MAELEFPIIYRPIYPKTGLVLTMACFPLWGMVTIMTFAGSLATSALALRLWQIHDFNFGRHFLDALMSLVLFLVGVLLTLVFSDSRILISKSGVTFPRFMLPWLQWRRERAWSDFSNIRFTLPDSVDIKKQRLELTFRSGGRVSLNLAAMPDDDPSRFLLALDVWGGQHISNPEMLATIRLLTKNQSSSALPMFTEMWEAELHHRFGSLSFVPLEPGHKARRGALQVVRQLNFGGHSAVYLALQNDRDLVVLKESVAPTFSSESARQKASEMFEREAVLLMKLQHPAICKVFDNFVEDGRHYLLLEYIPGRDLRQMVRETGPQSERDVLKWAMQIASVLEYMHECLPPVIHRDVTPDNIVLKESGDVTIVDFGAANEFLGTATGTLVGKQAYIAPEQFRGKATMQSDVYALGGTLFFLLTGLDPEPLTVSHPNLFAERISDPVNRFVASCTDLDVDRRVLCAHDVYLRAKELSEKSKVKSIPQKNNELQNRVIATNANSGTEKLVADLRQYAFPIIQAAFNAPFDFMAGRLSKKVGFIGVCFVFCVVVIRWICVTQELFASRIIRRVVNFLFYPLFLLLETIFRIYPWAVEQVWFGPFLLALLAVPIYTLLAWSKPFEPCSISLNADGISCHWKFGVFKSQKQLRWSEISGVALIKRSLKSGPEAWSVRFSSESNPRSSMQFRLTGLGDFRDRQRILDALTQWAPQAVRDPELLEAFTPATSGSYTELWLQSLASPPRRDRLKPLLAGTTLQQGKYVVKEQLGAGGQGVAYLAMVADSEIPVVLKESILPVYLDIDVRKTALEKFAREAEILRELHHEQIVELEDFFVEDHRGYLVLEHIRGLSLRNLISSNGRISEERTLELAKQMCTILTYLHQQSPPVVHRDFTPDNLILTPNNVLKLIDFTVADQSGKLKTATVVGKPSYMPPEQLRGKPSPQSDIYAMGATLYYLLTAVDPEPITSSNPHSVESSVSKDISDLVLKATALNTADRIQSASDFSKQLDLIS